MENETVIERSIKEFVFSKIQEKVFLDISKSGIISIKHQSKHGSTALAMFWLRVLRHQNNYPMPKYPYKDHYNKNGNNQVILKVDSVTLTTFMSTGTLRIQGMFVLEWFLNTFPVIMESYDAPVKNPQPHSTVYRQYTENWKKLRDHDREIKYKLDAEEIERENMALNVVEDRAKLIAKLTGKEIVTTVQRESGRSELAETFQKAADMAAMEMEEELELMTIAVWPEVTLKTHLNKLRTCCVQDGSTYIYPLWKSLLHYWFSDTDRKVYIVTPYLDTARLIDICHIIIDHRNEANLDAFYVHQKCDHSNNIFEVKKNALAKFDAKNQMFLEYKIYSSIIYPMKNFHAKFIGCVKGDDAEVLVTSANFHGDHFDTNNMDTVQYLTMPAADFIYKFLAPINASVQDKLNTGSHSIY